MKFAVCVFVTVSSDRGELQVILQRTPSHDVFSDVPLINAGQWRPTYVLPFDREPTGQAQRDAVLEAVGRLPDADLPVAGSDRRFVQVMVQKADLRSLRKTIDSGEFRAFPAEALAQLKPIDPLIEPAYELWNKVDAMATPEFHAALRSIGLQPEPPPVLHKVPSDVESDPLSLPTSPPPKMTLWVPPKDRIHVPGANATA